MLLHEALSGPNPTQPNPTCPGGPSGPRMVPIGQDLRATFSPVFSHVIFTAGPALPPHTLFSPPPLSPTFATSSQVITEDNTLSVQQFQSQLAAEKGKREELKDQLELSKKELSVISSSLEFFDRTVSELQTGAVLPECPVCLTQLEWGQVCAEGGERQRRRRPGRRAFYKWGPWFLFCYGKSGAGAYLPTADGKPPTAGG